MKKLLAVLDGHKLQLGLVLAALPDIGNQDLAILASLSSLFAGLHMDGAASHLTHASGLILAGIGAIHRVSKIVMEFLKDEPAK